MTLRALFSVGAALAALVAAPAAAQSPGSPPEDGIVGTLPGLPPNGLTGAAAGDEFGTSVADAGDVDGDGYDDVIVGAPYNDAAGANAGRAAVYLGGPSLANSPAIVLSGAAAGDQFGLAVAGAGDVNGDGYADLIVGAPYNDAVGVNAGRATIYFGGPAMDATADVVLTGPAAGDAFGFAVAGIGDANRDGFDDVAVGAPLHDSGGVDRGRAYIYFGGAAMNAVFDVRPRGQLAGDFFGVSLAGAGDVNGDGFADTVVGARGSDAAGLSSGRAYVVRGGVVMDGALAVTLTGQAAGDEFGWSVAGAGDLDGDGYGDVLVGAPQNDTAASAAGRAYVFRGGVAMDAAADLTLTGSAADSYLGWAVGGVGDLDGDGRADLAVGVPFGLDGAGCVQVYLGRAGLLPDAGPDVVVAGRAASETLGFAVGGGGDVDGDGRADLLAGAPAFDGWRGRVSVVGVRLTGEDLPDALFTGAAPFDQFGASVASAGDVNGDGHDDLLVGASVNDAGGTDAGRATLYFGGPGADTVADVTMTGAAASDYFGFSVAGAGDVNGDGFDDVLVSASNSSAGGTSAGRAYVFLGGAAMNNVADVTLTGEAPYNYFGYSAAGAGDVNGDGYADVIVGAYANNAGGSDAGRAYVYFGGPAMNSVADVTLTGEASFNYFGISAAGAGDVNGDGYADVVVGATGYDPGAAFTGRAYVFLGGASMNYVADVTMTGAAAFDYFGFSVAGAGDVDGDGYADVLVSASNNSAGGTSAGRATVYLGGAEMNSTADVTMTGAAAFDYFGTSVAGAGDVNGDGYGDVVVGAIDNDGGGTNAGRAYVFLGGTAMDSAADVTMTGAAGGDRLGKSVAAAGDVNGDGADDLIVGADLAGNTGRASLYLSTYPAAAPRLARVRDVPDDQGGFVTAEWTASAYDAAGDGRVTGYLVQRSRPASGGGLFWETVATEAAIGATGYSAVVPTYGVPAEGTSTQVVVRVVARTASAAESHVSAATTGASVDNIAPPPPLAPVATPGPAAVTLAWTAPDAADLAGYAVYRAPTSGVAPDSTTRVAVVGTGTTWTDVAAAPDQPWFYRVAARDASGNEGPPSAEASTVAVAGEAGAPTVFALSPVAPNPVTGASTLRYALPVATRVSLTVVDALGREVVRLVEGERGAGWHVARVPPGLSSGTYVVRLSAGTFAATQRMAVVR